MRSALAALFLALLTALPADAFDIGAMSDQERTLFRSEIRDYLIENPEVLMEAIAVLEQRRSQQAAEQDLAMIRSNRDAIFSDGYSFVGGNPDGDVTVVEFLDYRCAYCKRAFPAVEELISSDGNIRYIVKEYPVLGEQSTLASRYAIATKITAGDDLYKEVHNRLMSYRGDVNQGFLARLSRDLGLEHEDIVAQMDSDEVSRIIDENRALAARLNIQGTPTFVMGENFVRGYVELNQMRAIVNSIRREQG